MQPQDGLSRSEHSFAAFARQTGRLFSGPFASASAASQQSFGERHSRICASSQDQRGDAERSGASLPRYVLEPEKDVSQTRRKFLVLLGRPDSWHGRDRTAFGFNAIFGRRRCHTSFSLPILIAFSPASAPPGSPAFNAAPTDMLLSSYPDGLCEGGRRRIPTETASHTHYGE